MTDDRFILVTMTGNVKFMLPVRNIEAIREPMKGDVLEDDTRTIIVTRIGLSLFVKEDITFFLEMLGKDVLRRLDA